MRLNLYARSLLSIGFALTAVTTLVTYWDILQIRQNHERQLEARLKELTMLQSHSIANALWNLNRSNTYQILSSLEQDPDFFSARVITDSGKLFTEVRTNKSHAEAIITNEAPVIYDRGGTKHFIGTIQVSLVRDRLVKQQIESLKNSVMIGFIQLAAVLLVTFFILHRIIKPVVLITNRLIGLTKNDIDSTIPFVDRDDQIGNMACAVKTFQDNLIEIKYLREEEKKVNEKLSRARDSAEEANLAKSQQNRILEVIAKGDDIQSILDSIINWIESQLSDVRCSVLILDSDGKTLRKGAGPSLPEVYCQQLDGFEIGPHVGSCGTAAFRNEMVVVENIQTDPLWADFKELALCHDLRACWSTPIRNSEGKVLGTFCSYYNQQRKPTEEEIKLVDSATSLAGIAIHRTTVEKEILESKNRYQTIFHQLRSVMEGTSSDVGDKFFYSLVRNLAGSLNVRYAILGEYSSLPCPSIQTVAIWDGNRFRENVKYDLANTPCEKVLASRGVQYYPKDIPKLFRNCQLLKDMNVESYLGLPLFDPSGVVTGNVMVMDDKSMRDSSNSEMILSIFASRAEVELDRKRKEEKLLKANIELERANQAKSGLLSGMSHELRTPLNAIIGYTDLLKANVYGVLTEKQYKSIQTIQESGQHLLSLITDLLDISKIDAGALSLDIVSLSIPEVVTSVIAMFTTQTVKKELRIHDRIDASISMSFADFKVLKQILVNLLSNAIKFSHHNGGIEINVFPFEKHFIKFEVIDHGVGIEEDEQRKIFSEFYQVDHARDSKLGGTGLGLALTKRLVEVHGGVIGVKSEPNKGSTFWFTIPWKESKPVEGEVKTSTVHDLIMNRHKILLVEDNQTNINITRDILAIKNHYVTTAKNGKEAIEKAELESPDIILMDLQMPVMDGYTATKELRSIPAFADIPIIALTASADQASVKHAMDAGCTEHISKPVTAKTLLSVINRYLSDD